MKMHDNKLRTVFIGTGNVAYTLIPALASLSCIEPVAIACRNSRHAREIIDAADIRKVAICNLSDIPSNADLYISMLSDDALISYIHEFPVNNAIWLHTSGSLSADILKPLTDHLGVLYPLQTFSKGRKIDIRTVPFFIEASDKMTGDILTEISRQLSCNVRNADSKARRHMHIAAVFACNFTNSLWTIADEQLSADGIDISFLRPLIEETLEKAMTIGPEAGQTGPARRGDRRVMDSHIEMLTGMNREIYRLLSENIMKKYHS